MTNTNKDLQNSLREVVRKEALQEVNLFGFKVPTSSVEFENLVVSKLVQLLTQNSDFLNKVLKKVNFEVTVKN